MSAPDTLARPGAADRTPDSPSPDGDVFLENAARIGDRIASLAEWNGEECTWTVMSPDRDNGSREAIPTTAGGTLYEGTSGIALFLAELAGLTGDAEAARAAVGGLRFAVREAGELPPNASGLHAGRTGIALAATRAADALGRDELREWARQVALPMATAEMTARGMDVIGGAAGAIPALLEMRPVLGDAWVMEQVRRMGEQISAAAIREPEGWSWNTMPNASARSLNGYAHGAAGFGHALLELAAATGDGAYLHGAEQAFTYERRTFHPPVDNWPDLRHTDLSEYLQSGQLDELRDRLRAGNAFPPFTPRYMSAWCHGAPGIGLTRLRAWQLTGEPLFREEAEAAVRATVVSLLEERMNYSLCHGRSGNLETLLLASEILGDGDSRAVAERVMLEGCARYEAQGRRWPCGTLAGVADPGLLLGEAGIGHFLLRMARPSVRSILLVTPPTPPIDVAAVEPARREARARDVAHWFGRTAAAFRALGATDVVESAAESGDRVRAPVAIAADAVEAAIGAETDPARAALLDDASRAERARVALHRSVEDAAEEFLDALVRPPEGEVAWDEVRIALGPRARVEHAEHDWDAWVQDGAPAPGPEEDDVFHLLRFSAGQTTERRLSPFAAVVLRSLREPATLGEVVERVAAIVTGDREPDRAWLRERVLEQIRQAYRAGFVEQQPAPAKVPG
jgi:lantibiotic biosynthesis protein